MERAGLKSLADSYKEEVLRKSGQPGLQRFPAVPKILGQVQRYAEQFSVRYFAISTYQVTWLCEMDGKLLRISEGWAHDDADVPVLQALLWMSVMAINRPLEPADTTDSPPPPDQPTSQGSLSISAPRKETPPDDLTQDCPGPSAATELELRVDARDVLGHGLCGTVWAGRLNGVPVAVKSSEIHDSRTLLILHEAELYQSPLRNLQGLYIPRLLYSGPSPMGRAYCLVTSRIWGRQMTPSDGALLPQALLALRAVHAAGVLHGDVRLPNFIVRDDPGASPRVIILDFGQARIKVQEEEADEEVAELHDLFDKPPPFRHGRHGSGQRIFVGDIEADRGLWVSGSTPLSSSEKRYEGRAQAVPDRPTLQRRQKVVPFLPSRKPVKGLLQGRSSNFGFACFPRV